MERNNKIDGFLKQELQDSMRGKIANMINFVNKLCQYNQEKEQQNQDFETCLKEKVQYLNNFSNKFDEQFVNYYSKKYDYKFQSFKDVNFELPEEDEDEDDDY